MAKESRSNSVTLAAADNPYLQLAVEACGGSPVLDQYKRVWPDDTLTVHQARDYGIREYGFAVPTPEALALIARYAPILEVGAGTGYWAYLLRQMGVDILAVDKYPPPGHRDPSIHLRFAKTWTDVGQADELIVEHYPDRSLLLVWPSYNQNWPSRALARYQGSVVLYVGEPYGGCTADDAFHECLEQEWDEESEAPVFQWIGTHDRLWAYRRTQRL